VRLNQAARLQLAARAEPIEFEADLQYPGAPPSRTAVGGETVRRLLDAYGRDPEFAEWARTPALRAWMQAYFGESVLLSRVHHNCSDDQASALRQPDELAPRYPVLVIRARGSGVGLARARRGA
jgi:hypothetical protein